MRSSTLLIFINLFVLNLKAQDTTLSNKAISFENIEGLSYEIPKIECSNNFVLPKYKLGNNHFGKYLRDHTRYPISPTGDRILVKGQLIISFIISTTGKIKEINIITSPNEQISNNLIGAINKLMPFETAKCNGNAIDVLIYYSAFFKPD
jgi:hypothetical protein